MIDRQEMEAVAEAILFVANEPVPRAKLLEVFSESQREAAESALEAVLGRYREDPAKGVMIDEVGSGLRIVSRPDLHSYLRRFFEVTGSNKLSMAALETLAIIAYRQPVTAPEIQELRSTNSSGVLKKLLERRLIRISGRKEVVGKPFLYATTREFLLHFGLRSLKDLPPLEQFEELFGGELEGAFEEAPPDPEEQVEQAVAELEEAEGDAAEQAAAEAVEQEREQAEAAEEPAANEATASEAVEEPQPQVPAKAAEDAAPDAAEQAAEPEAEAAGETSE